MKKGVVYLLLLFLQQVALGQTSPVGIDTTITTTIGDMQQVIAMKGKDRTKPLLVYLHGAAGNQYSLIANANKLTSKLQEHFVVVLWDQRDYGKTMTLNQSSKPVNLQLLVSDTQEVVEYCLTTFKRKKLYLVGHSMGSVMGMYTAQQHPEHLYALIEISPPVNGIESQKIGLSLLKNHFKQVNNERAIKELATVKLPARDFESLFTKYVWQTEYDGEPVSDTVRAQLKPMLQQWMDTPAASLSNEVFKLDFGKQFPRLTCPIYFFVGRKDVVTNATLTEVYYKNLKAPKKQLFWFEQSAHSLPDTEPELMQATIIEKILPFTHN